MSESPLLSGFIALMVASVLTAPFRYGFRAYNRHLRSKNIAAHGWPPEHLDADGDFKPEPEEEEE